MLEARKLVTVLTLFSCAMTTPHFVEADSHAVNAKTVPINRISVDGVEDQTGKIQLRQIGSALEVIVELDAFPPGWHAMHVHENPSCMPSFEDGVMIAGAAAGAHYDPNGVMNMDGSTRMEMTNKVMEPIAPRDGKATILAQVQQPTMANPNDSMEQSARVRPRGDLPSVYVEADGTTRFRIVSYRLQLSLIHI